MKYLRDLVFESILLLEYDRDKTIKNHGNNVLNALKEAPYSNFGMTHHVEKRAHEHLQAGDEHKALHTLIDHFETLDPSPQKKHVSNMARIYAKGGIERFEDMGRLASALHDHHELSKRKKIPAEHRDAGKIKTLHDAESLVDKYSDVLSGKEQDAAHHEKMKSESTIEDHAEFTHIIPHTEAASQHFGKGTKWCTAAKRNCMFDNYNKNGNLHIINPKNPKYEGEKYQFHIPDGEGNLNKDYTMKDTQLMDEGDNLAHDKLENNHPEIYNHLNRYFDDAKKKSSTPEGLDHPENFVRKSALENAKIDSNDPRLEKILNEGPIGLQVAAHKHLPKYDPRPYNQLKSFLDTYNPKVDDDEWGDVNDYMEYKGDIGNLNHPSHIQALYDSDKDAHAYRISGHKYATLDMLKEFSKHPGPGVRNNVAEHNKTPIDVLEKLAKDNDYTVRESAKESLSKKSKPSSSGIHWHSK